MAEIPSGRRRNSHNLHSSSPTPLSQSMKDVLYVAPDTLCNDRELKLKSRKGSANSLFCDAPGAHNRARQDSENEHAEVVIVCEPEGTSLMMGGLHPRSEPDHKSLEGSRCHILSV